MAAKRKRPTTRRARRTRRERIIRKASTAASFAGTAFVGQQVLRGYSGMLYSARGNKALFGGKHPYFVTGMRATRTVTTNQRVKMGNVGGRDIFMNVPQTKTIKSAKHYIVGGNIGTRKGLQPSYLQLRGTKGRVIVRVPNRIAYGSQRVKGQRAIGPARMHKQSYVGKRSQRIGGFAKNNYRAGARLMRNNPRARYAAAGIGAAALAGGAAYAVKLHRKRRTRRDSKGRFAGSY